MFDAVLAIYAEDGWAGLTFAAVARRAAVGKSSLYLRWDNTATMLVDALRMRPPMFDTTTTGTVRGDLIKLADEVLRYAMQSAGLVGLRLFVDAQFHPELTAALLNNLYTGPAARARTVIERGIESGELDPSISVSVVLYALFGGAINHVISNPDTIRTTDVATERRVIENLVDLILHGAVAGRPAAPARPKRRAKRPVRSS